MDASRDARVLRSTALRALLIAESISTTGSQMTWLALPWFVLITTGSPARMSFVVAAELAGYVLVGIPAGSAITRFGARRTMLLCDALRGPLMLSIPLMHAAGLLSFWLLVLIAAAEGALGLHTERLKGSPFPNCWVKARRLSAERMHCSKERTG